MSFVTTATRMWLLKSFKPFNFTNEFDNYVTFEDCESLGLYVHIPFCENICKFCPYCKVKYEKQLCDSYINHLLEEITLVSKKMLDKKEVTSLYFGGGSPALVADRLLEIINKLKEKFIIKEGIGVELHPKDITVETLTKLKDAGITKISIGIQSFSQKFLDTLGREQLDIKSIENCLSEVPFETVSMDFIFALPNQTFEDLKYDIDKAFSIGANHIAIYPFINFAFTNNDVPAMTKSKKHKLLDEITLYCQEKGYERDSIWTFSNVKTAKYSSMTRENFLGFGCSATTLVKKQFKVNTFSILEYEKRIDEKLLPTSLTINFTKRQRMIYFLFWTAYSTQVDPKDFEKFFGVSLNKMYGFEIFIAKLVGFITCEDGVYKMTLKGAFYYHYYESFYTLSYIDKMWGIMKNEAFPKELSL